MDENLNVELFDESGNMITVTHLLTYAHNGSHYIAFSDTDDNVHLFKIDEKSDKDDVYLPIENAIELEEAWAIFKDIYYEEEESEEEEL